MDQWNSEYNQLKQLFLGVVDVKFNKIKESLTEAGYEIDENVKDLKTLIKYFEENGKLNKRNVDILANFYEQLGTEIILEFDNYTFTTLPHYEQLYPNDPKEFEAHSNVMEATQAIENITLNTENDAITKRIAKVHETYVPDNQMQFIQGESSASESSSNAINAGPNTSHFDPATQLINTQRSNLFFGKPKLLPNALPPKNQPPQPLPTYNFRPNSRIPITDEQKNKIYEHISTRLESKKWHEFAEGLNIQNGRIDKIKNNSNLPKVQDKVMECFKIYEDDLIDDFVGGITRALIEIKRQDLRKFVQDLLTSGM